MGTLHQIQVNTSLDTMESVDLDLSQCEEFGASGTHKATRTPSTVGYQASRYSSQAGPRPSVEPGVGDAGIGGAEIGGVAPTG